jgi:hypothetical protein
MAVPQHASSDVPQAVLRLPLDWLMPWVDVDTIREAQRPDVLVKSAETTLVMAGVELIVERRWLREAYWAQLKQAISHGYIYKSSAVQVTLRGERRERERRNPKAA